MRTIRASEIAAYLYCNRAWWYRRQGVTSANQADLAAGRNLHAAHGRMVMASGCLRLLAFALLLAGVIVLTAALTARLL